MISLRYALTPEDFANFTIYVQVEAPGKKKGIFKRVRPLIIIIAVIFIANITSSIASGTLDFSSFIGLPIILFLFLYPTLSAKPLFKKQALQFAANPENAAVFNMTDHFFSETGIIIKDTTKEIKFQWAAFIKKQENDQYIFLFLQSNNALIIPKRVLRSQVEKEQLDKLLSQYISFDAEVGHLVKE